ncbi:serine/threonine-protein kinase [Lacipirellula limnantheis]|uniref:non-specific serine/threonine protein kinase n=1 Tax=Lacipirellula limnantheis TaxID=2528024 RepID=A0A517TUF2_9BACT|nr:serine/threonine-protein kinase [Lacipirellula limnantheis]QDT71997.1 Serine/threonine-protein kinase PrkC [Lacipirellula limnantheis]
MTALLEMNPSPVQSDDVDLQVKPPMRFTYPSGSRPLDGYTIKRGVGRGGFGEVYFAVSDAGKEVALKLIRRNLEVELRGVTHCLNLKHPNLVALYDIKSDEHEDRWVVMEYVSGESLEDAIDRYPSGMPTAEAMRWFEGICAAVAYLHDHGIVHRDLKPANIFVDDGIVKIGDYGLSKFISCSRRSGQTESVGTVHYMAPEIANGRYGREIDAYALGIILYEMITGRVPFEGESVGEVLMKHLTAEPKLELLDEPFRTVVRGAMAKDPEQRINSAAEMMQLLRGVDRGAQPSPAFAAATANGFNSPGGPTAPPVRTASMPTRDDSLVAFFHRDPEPLWHGVESVWKTVRRDMNYDQWPIVGRLAFLVGCFIAVTQIWPVVMALLTTFVVPYCLYRIVRVIVQSTTTDPNVRLEVVGGNNRSAFAVDSPLANELTASESAPPTHQPQLATAAQPVSTKHPWRRRGQASWRHAAYQELQARPARQRASSVLGSMLAAGIVGPVAALLACLIIAPELHLELYLWMAMVTSLASWALIIPSQLIEGKMEDHAPLRFFNLLAGALVGLAAWAISNMAYVGLPASHGFSPGPTETMFQELFDWNVDGVQAAYNSGNVIVPMTMQVAYFAFLFVALRWWRMAEWTRPSRVSLWAIAFAGFIGWALTFLWWFPQPTGMLLAAAIAFTVQLSSPWLSPSQRRELAQRAV